MVNSAISGVNKIGVLNKIPYADTWGDVTSSYVEINPSAGYTNDDDKHHFFIQTSWSGSITKVQIFCQSI